MNGNYLKNHDRYINAGLPTLPSVFGLIDVVS